MSQLGRVHTLKTAEKFHRLYRFFVDCQAWMLGHDVLDQSPVSRTHFVEPLAFRGGQRGFAKFALLMIACNTIVAEEVLGDEGPDGADGRPRHLERRAGRHRRWRSRFLISPARLGSNGFVSSAGPQSGLAFAADEC